LSAPRSSVRAGAVLALAILVFLPVVAAQQEYLDALSVQLDAAQVHFDEAADALSTCSDAIVNCFQNREPYALRLESAGQGLLGIQDNLSAMDVPERYRSDHAMLQDGFQQVTEGLLLYAAAIRTWDTGNMSRAGQLTQAGRLDIRTASTSILSRPVGDAHFALLAGVVVLEGVVVVAFVLVVSRRVARTRRADFERDWASCPECGEVMDQWWTFKKRQVREWRATHLKGHPHATEGGVGHRRSVDRRTESTNHKGHG